VVSSTLVLFNLVVELVIISGELGLVILGSHWLGSVDLHLLGDLLLLLFVLDVHTLVGLVLGLHHLLQGITAFEFGRSLLFFTSLLIVLYFLGLFFFISGIPVRLILSLNAFASIVLLLIVLSIPSLFSLISVFLSLLELLSRTSSRGRKLPDGTPSVRLGKRVVHGRTCLLGFGIVKSGESAAFAHHV
jgi:hypothetical protein